LIENHGNPLSKSSSLELLTNQNDSETKTTHNKLDAHMTSWSVSKNSIECAQESRQVIEHLHGNKPTMHS